MIAYLDPATGSMLLSVVAGGAAGIAVGFKWFGHRMRKAIFFWRKDEATVLSTNPVEEADIARLGVEASTPSD